MARKRQPNPQINIFEYAARNGITEIGAADDLPLFSGQPISVPIAVFNPPVVGNQPTLFDIRLDPFHTRKEAS